MAQKYSFTISESNIIMTIVPSSKHLYTVSHLFAIVSCTHRALEFSFCAKECCRDCRDSESCANSSYRLQFMNVLSHISVARLVCKI